MINNNNNLTLFATRRRKRRYGLTVLAYLVWGIFLMMSVGTEPGSAYQSTYSAVSELACLLLLIYLITGNRTFFQHFYDWDKTGWLLQCWLPRKELAKRYVLDRITDSLIHAGMATILLGHLIIPGPIRLIHGINIFLGFFSIVTLARGTVLMLIHLPYQTRLPSFLRNLAILTRKGIRTGTLLQSALLIGLIFLTPYFSWVFQQFSEITIWQSGVASGFSVLLYAGLYQILTGCEFSRLGGETSEDRTDETSESSDRMVPTHGTIPPPPRTEKSTRSTTSREILSTAWAGLGKRWRYAFVSYLLLTPLLFFQYLYGLLILPFMIALLGTGPNMFIWNQAGKKTRNRRRLYLVIHGVSSTALTRASLLWYPVSLFFSALFGAGFSRDPVIIGWFVLGTASFHSIHLLLNLSGPLPFAGNRTLYFEDLGRLLKRPGRMFKRFAEFLPVPTEILKLGLQLVYLPLLILMFLFLVLQVEWSRVDLTSIPFHYLVYPVIGLGLIGLIIWLRDWIRASHETRTKYDLLRERFNLHQNRT